MGASFLLVGGKMVVVERLPDPDGIVTEYPSHSLTVKNILPIKLVIGAVSPRNYAVAYATIEWCHEIRET